MDIDYYEEAFKLTNHIFIKLAKQNMNDSAGEKTMLAHRCVYVWTDELANSDNKLRKAMFKWFLKHLDNINFEDMSDYLEEFLFDNFIEEEFLGRKFEFIEQMVEKYQEIRRIIGGTI